MWEVNSKEEELSLAPHREGAESFGEDAIG